jgi:hypothetical protein
MEAKPGGDTRTNDTAKEKEKRKWGRTFYNFLASGGIIVLIVLGFVLVVVISVLIK